MSDRNQLTDRETLLLVAEQVRSMQSAMDRLSTSLESRLAQGDRRFAEQDAKIATLDQHFRTATNAINLGSGRQMDLEGRLGKLIATVESHVKIAATTEALGKAQAANEALEKRIDTLEEEYRTWKVRVQTGATIFGLIWAFIQFVLPYIQIQLAAGTP